MMKTMIRWSALLTVALLMLPVSGCNKGRGGEDNPDQPDLPEQPEQVYTAMTEVGLASDAGISNNSTRAEFIGEVGHKTHMPNLIKWGEIGAERKPDGTYTFDDTKALPIWVLAKSHNLVVQGYKEAKLYLTDDYHGILKFTYTESDVDKGDNKLRYVAATYRGTDTWMGDGTKQQEAGAWVTKFDHLANNDYFIYYTNCVPEIPAGLKTRRPYITAGRWDDKCGWRPIDISNRSVAWPMLSYPADDDNKMPDPSKFWCEVTHNPSGSARSTGQVYFKLFGNMVNIRIANNSGREAYDVSYPNDKDVKEMFKRPHLVIESNCMLFAPASFRFDPGRNGGYDVRVDSKVNKIAFRVDNLKFTKRGEEQNFPIWFRPVPPPAGEDCKITITWKIYSVADRKWYTETRNLNPDFAKNNIYPATGTVFDALNGHYYTFDLAFNASYGLEFGTEKFFEVVNDVPPFD